LQARAPSLSAPALATPHISCLPAASALLCLSLLPSLALLFCPTFALARASHMNRTTARTRARARSAALPPILSGCAL
jgi:hypothetical protein